MVKGFAWILVLFLLVVNVSALVVPEPVATSSKTRYLLVNFTNFNVLHNHRIMLNDSTVLVNSTLYEVLNGSSMSYSFSAINGINLPFTNLLNRTILTCDNVNPIYSSTIFLNLTYSDGTTYQVRTDLGGANTVNFNIANPFKDRNVTKINLTGGHSTGGALSCSGIDFYNLTNNNSLIIDLYAFNRSIGEYFVNVTGFNSSHNITSNLSGRFNITSNTLLNISVLSYTGSIIPFTINLSGTVKSGNGSVTFDVVKDRVYNINTSASSFASNHTALNVSHFSIFYKNISLSANNSVNLSIYNLATLGIITQNVTVVVTGATVRSFNTITGNILLTDVSTGVNELKVYNENFTESRYALDIVDGAAQTFYAYLNPVSSAQNVTFTFYDLSGALIEGVYLYQYTLTNLTPVLSMVRVSDIAGKVYFNYIPTYYYFYNISSTDYVGSPFILNPPVEPNYDITLTPISALVSYAPLNTSGSYTFNNVTEVISFSYVSSESDIASYDLFVYVGRSLVCHNVSSALSNVFVCDVSAYSGTVSLYATGDNRIFFGSTFELPESKLSDLVSIQEASFLSGLLALILIIAGATINIFVALVFGVIALLVVYWIGIFGALSTIVITVVVIVSVVIAVIIRRRY